MNQATALQLLELSIGVTLEEVKSAYRRKAMLHHPDKGGRKEDFIEIKRAYDHLCMFGTQRVPIVSGFKVVRVWCCTTINSTTTASCDFYTF